MKNTSSDLYETHKEQELLKSANEKYRSKIFFEEWKPMRNFSTNSSFVFHAFSIAFAVSFWYVFFNQFTKSQPVLIFFALSIPLIFEVFKAGIIQKAFFTWYRYSRSLAFFAFGLLSICLLFFSVYSSLEGAKQFIILQDTKIADFQETLRGKQDSINSHFDSKIAYLQGELSNYKNQVSYKGKINIHNKTNQKVISGYHKEIEANNKAKQEQSELLKAELKTSLPVLKSKVAYNVILLLVISAFVEIMIVLTTWFPEYFDYRSYQESNLAFHYEKPFQVTLSQFEKIINTQLNNNSMPMINIDNEKPEIGFQSKKKGFDNEALIKDLKAGNRNYKSLCKKHSVNVLTIERYKKEFCN